MYYDMIQSMPQNNGVANRESIWSVSRRFRSIYSAVFIALFGFGVLLAVKKANQGKPDDGWNWYEHVDAVVSVLGVYSIAAAATAMVATEILGVIVMLADTLREIIQDKRQKRYDRIREEARQEARREILEQESAVGSFLCPIWSTPSKLLPSSTSTALVFTIDSPDAGGKYEITFQLLAEIMSRGVVLTEHDKEAINHWLAGQRDAGVDMPLLTDEVVRKLLSS